MAGNAHLGERRDQVVPPPVVLGHHSRHRLVAALQRLRRGLLARGRRAHDRVLVQLHHVFGNLRRRARVADAEARHGPRLRHAVQEDRPLLHAGNRHEADMLRIVGQFRIDFVRQQQQVVLLAEIGDVLDVLLREHRARRVARKIQHQHARLRRHRLFEHGAREAELVLAPRFHAHGHAAGHDDGRPVAHEARLVVNHLVAGIEHRAQGDVDGLAHAHRHQRLLVPVVFRAELPRHVAADRLAQRRIAAVRRVVRRPALQRKDRRLAHGPRRVEIRLAHAERDHVLAGRDNVEKLADARKRQRLHVRRHSALATHRLLPSSANYGLTCRRSSAFSPSISTPSCL